LNLETPLFHPLPGIGAATSPAAFQPLERKREKTMAMASGVPYNPGGRLDVHRKAQSNIKIASFGCSHIHPAIQLRRRNLEFAGGRRDKTLMVLSKKKYEKEAESMRG